MDCAAIWQGSSVRQRGSVRQCTSGSLWQCARWCAAVRLLMYGDSARGSVRLSGSAAVCCSAAVCSSAAVCGSVSGSA